MTKKRQKKKKKYKIKPKNIMAASLSLPQFKQKIIRNKKKESKERCDE